ncbi:hypothetical protein AB0C27_53715 [Nonomuraea sp. NPDC048882]|uniref:hypothetical protein n=1 Tax=Nonomuraea sp. NPDC048882 TaxID=3154347 RepID=UPI0033DA4B93
MSVEDLHGAARQTAIAALQSAGDRDMPQLLQDLVAAYNLSSLMAAAILGEAARATHAAQTTAIE